MAGRLVCPSHHSFDLAREGYVNLGRSGGRWPATGGDSPAQQRHRAAFLDAGHLDAIAATIAQQMRRGADNKSVSGQWRILDAGCGTGHHLARLAAALPPVVELGLDIAKNAARQAARMWPMLAFAVADLWTEWPLPDAAVDLVISVFAPKNFPEAA